MSHPHRNYTRYIVSSLLSDEDKRKLEASHPFQIMPMRPLQIIPLPPDTQELQDTINALRMAP